MDFKDGQFMIWTDQLEIQHVFQSAACILIHLRSSLPQEIEIRSIPLAEIGFNVLVIFDRGLIYIRNGTPKLYEFIVFVSVEKKAHEAK
jgi:hypothetical protein